MKRTFKKLLPILLGLFIIFSLAWYLLVYDQSFTRDMLISGARYFHEQGNHSVATWLYDQAYLQSKDNAAVAIELSDNFKKLGNYTKAETTLTKAIASNASPELYIALSQTYVEQDKLLDAVKMLDNITNPEIKAQLDVLRPAPPSVDIAPGFYNQYYTLSITSEGTLYVTADADYPSVKEDLSDGKVTLVNGENQIYALCIGENGLVSALSIFGYTVGGVIEPITLNDPVLDTAVRQALNVGADTQLYSNQLWEITQLTVPEGIADFDDFSRLPYLQSLTVSGSAAGSLKGLESLTQLKQLCITDASLSASDLLIVAGLPKLTELTLSDCGLSSIGNLSAASGLTYLDLQHNAIRDISPLSFMKQLKELDLSHNALENLSALSGLSQLESLNVSYNSLTSLVPLAGCTGLKVLNVSNNKITVLTGLDSLTGLAELSCSYNELTAVTPIAGCTGLIKLDVSNNEITDITSISTLKKLEIFNFSRNKVSALPKWKDGCALITIDGSYNKIKSLSNLSGCQALNNVLMDYNKITSVSPLAKCYNLIKVSVYGNSVKDVSALTDMSVIVNYNPV